MVELTYPQHIALAEVMVETQLIASNRTKGNVCSAIMVSIELESPAPTQRRRGEGRNIGHDSHVEAHLINTPSSLMALGKHIVTPRQCKVWEFKNK